jgi:COMPASS component SWD1
MTNEIPHKQILPSAPKRATFDGDDHEKQAAQDAKQVTCVTVFTASGNHIVSGTNKGWLNVIETLTCETVYSTRLSTSVLVLIRLTSSGRDMVINCTDRIIRTVKMGKLADDDVEPSSINLEVEHKFQDVVNRLSWNHVAFGTNGEYVIASTYMNHDIYIWERRQGSLVKILEGPREELGAVEWHPSRPFVIACGLDTGNIYYWSVITPQRWSALAPDFAEVEENVEYIEREDEFDIHDAEEIHKRRLDLEDDDIDVLTIDRKEEDEDEFEFVMPVLLGVDDSESEEEIVAVGPGTMRRKSPGEGREWMNGAESDNENGKRSLKKKKAVKNAGKSRKRKTDI